MLQSERVRCAGRAGVRGVGGAGTAADNARRR